MTGAVTRTVDVVVIGAGIAGASAAWRLAPECSVAVVEMEPTPGFHATGRSAAMLNETSGEPVVCALARASRPFLASPPEEMGGALLRPRGLLWVGAAGTSPQLAELVTKAPTAACPIDESAARRLVPSLRAVAMEAGAVYEASAMTIDVAALLAGYVRGLRAAGGRIYAGAELLSCSRRSQGWVVEAGEHRLACAVVINAAGAWADTVMGRAGLAPLGFEPRRRTAALAVAPESVAAWPMVMDVEGGWYAEPETGGLLISPADETLAAPGDARPDELDVALAMERVNRSLGLEVRSIRRAWAGLRTFAPDRVPVVGPHPDDGTFVLLAGQGGSGIKTAPALADVVRDLIIDGRAPPAELSPARFQR